MSIILSDNFTRANANPIGGIYTTVAGLNAIQILSNAAFGSVANTTSGVVDTTNVYPNNQYATITLGIALGFLNSTVSVRCTNSGSITEAEFVVGSGTTAAALVIRIASTPTTVATPTLNTVPTSGDTYTLAVTGQTYLMYQNGALIGTYTDGSSRLTSGSVGFWVQSETPVSGGNSITLFQAGSLVVPFLSIDLSNPVSRREVPSADLHVVAYKYIYPFNQYDWLVSKRPIAQQPEQILNKQILGITASIKPFYPVDLPYPSQRRKTIMTDQIENPLVYVSGTPENQPFNLDEWPNVNLNKRDLYAHTFNSSAISYLRPFNYLDWPSPPKSFYKQQEASGPNTLILGIPPVIFINTTVLRIPLTISITRKTAPVADNYSTSIVLSSTVPAAPFYQNDQPNPSRRPISYPDFNGPIPLTLGIGISPIPFFLNDQPNPSRRPISYPDFNGPIPLTLGIPNVLLPLFSVDIPNPHPVHARYQPDLIPNNKVLIIKPPLKIFSNYDWPTPSRRKDINNEGIWIFGGIQSNIPGGKTWAMVQDNDTPNWNPILPVAGAWAPVIDVQSPNWGNVKSPTPPIEGGVD